MLQESLNLHKLYSCPVPTGRSLLLHHPSALSSTRVIWKHSWSTDRPLPCQRGEADHALHLCRRFIPNSRRQKLTSTHFCSPPLLPTHTISVAICNQKRTERARVRALWGPADSHLSGLTTRNHGKKWRFPLLWAEQSSKVMQLKKRQGNKIGFPANDEMVLCFVATIKLTAAVKKRKSKNVPQSIFSVSGFLNNKWDFMECMTRHFIQNIPFQNQRRFLTRLHCLRLCSISIRLNSEPENELGQRQTENTKSLSPVTERKASSRGRVCWHAKARTEPSFELGRMEGAQSERSQTERQHIPKLSELQIASDLRSNLIHNKIFEKQDILKVAQKEKKALPYQMIRFFPLLCLTFNESITYGDHGLPSVVGNQVFWKNERKINTAMGGEKKNDKLCWWSYYNYRRERATDDSQHPFSHCCRNSSKRARWEDLLIVSCSISISKSCQIVH